MDPNIPSTIRVAFVVEGSRGDIQPYVAIALKLRERGNIVRIFTNSDHPPFCDSFDIPTEGVLYDFSDAFGQPHVRRALSDGSAFKMAKALRKIRMNNLSNDWSKLWPALESFAPTVLLSGGIAKSKAMLYSNMKTVPLVIVDLQVLLPLSDKGPVGLPTLPFGTNKLWWKLILAGAASHLKGMKTIVRDTLGIDPDGKFELPLMHTSMTDIPNMPGPVCIGMSTHLIPVHPEWPTENFYPCGFFTLTRERQERLMKDPSKGSQFGAESNAALTKFLSEGSPPVYLGWGSMICKSPQWMVSVALEALQNANARGVLLGGWAGLGKDHVPEHLNDFCEQNVIFVSSAPHEWLFPQCACVVHHGGSGTTAASVRSCKPTIITPIQGDQFDFADGINTIGCGIGLPHLSGVTGKELGHAISKCLSDSESESETIRARAEEIGAKLRSEDGCENFCKVFDEWLTNDVVSSGKWLRKHQALLRKCEESWKAQQQTTTTTITTACTIS